MVKRMRINKTIYSLFKRGSKTYFYSTRFFPKEAREEVFILYSFLRKADDYVDSIPQDGPGYYAFRERYNKAKQGIITGDVVVDSFIQLVERKNFKDEWVEAFLNSMEMDITRNSYENLDELKTYLYGSSEVVGLFMARIMGLPSASYPAAQKLGRSMQYINFIRDIAEDLELGRVYFPQEDLRKYGVKSLREEDARENAKGFIKFIHRQLDVYSDWQKKAEAGFKYIPYRYLIPVKTASDMYKWTAEQIRRNPFIVYRKKVKPSIPRIVGRVMTNSLRLPLS